MQLNQKCKLWCEPQWSCQLLSIAILVNNEGDWNYLLGSKSDSKPIYKGVEAVELLKRLSIEKLSKHCILLFNQVVLILAEQFLDVSPEITFTNFH